MAPRETTRPRLRVLVVEDNEFNAMLMIELLRKRGHDVELAKGGVEAIERLETRSFDLMLLDLHMPDLDGFAVIARVREQERTTGEHLPVIASTARSRKEDRERCLASGMDHFLAKPIRSETLWAAIDEVVRTGPSREAEMNLIDAETLLGACAGDPVILNNLCAILRNRLPAEMNHAVTLAAQNDAAALRESAHKLHGMVATVSSQAGALASRLEDEAEQGDLTSARGSAARLSDLVNEILTRLDTISIAELERERTSTERAP